MPQITQSAHALILPMTSHPHLENLVYHTSSPSIADVGLTSPSPNTCQSVMPILGISQQPTLQYTTAAYPHGGLSEQADKGRNWRHITIEWLPEDTLLEIFDFYRLGAIDRSRGRPWKWHRLAHVCQKWRHVVQTSPRRLGLQIYCKSGPSIEPILDVWSTLPLVVLFRGTSKSRSLPKNVITALSRPDRICEINLSMPSPMIRSIVDAIQVPFPALERIQIASTDTTESPVVGTFLGGSAPRLKEIDLRAVAVPFPALRRLLLSTDNLVELRLENIPNTCYFSPDALVIILSSLTKLKWLRVYFRPPTSRSAQSRTSQPLERAILSSLLEFGFYGASEYLEEFVARIDLPALINVSIWFYNQLIFEIPQLCQFLSRVGGLESFTELNLTPAEKAAVVFFRRKGKRLLRPLECYISIPCTQLDWQLSFATQIFSQLPVLPSNAKTFVLYKPLSMSAGKEDVDPAQWLELFQPLSHVSQIRVNLEELVPNVVQALVSADMTTEVLPDLTSLILTGYRKSPPVIVAAKQFVATRKVAGRSVSLRG